MNLFKRNRKDHWERVYKTLSPSEVGWYQAYPESSIKLIDNTGAGTDSRIIDVGGGTSRLSMHLLENGFSRLTVLDISGNAIEKAKMQYYRAKEIAPNSPLLRKYNIPLWIEAKKENI